MRAAAVIAILLGLPGAAGAAGCPTGADLADGIVLESHGRYIVHHRAIDDLTVWQVSRFYDPPTPRRGVLWLLDHGLMEILVQNLPPEVRTSERGWRANTYDGDLSALRAGEGAQVQLRSTHTGAYAGTVHLPRIDRFEVTGTREVRVGACTYDALVVAHRYEYVKTDGTVFRWGRTQHWIPELRLVASGWGTHRDGGFRSIRRRAAGDWFGDRPYRPHPGAGMGLRQ